MFQKYIQIHFQILFDSNLANRNPNTVGTHGAIRFQSGKTSGLFFLQFGQQSHLWLYKPVASWTPAPAIGWDSSRWTDLYQHPCGSRRCPHPQSCASRSCCRGKGTLQMSLLQLNLPAETSYSKSSWKWCSTPGSALSYYWPEVVVITMTALEDRRLGIWN